MSNCAACGKPKANIGMGGTLLCSPCSEDIRVEVDQLRSKGKPVSVPAIARRMRREQSTDIRIRECPDDLHRQIKSQAALDGLSLQEWMLVAAREKLEQAGE